MEAGGNFNFQLKIENLKILQSPSYLVGGEAMDADHFGPRGLTADDFDLSFADAERLGQQREQRSVGLALHRRRLHTHFECAGLPAVNAALGRAWHDLDGDGGASHSGSSASTRRCTTPTMMIATMGVMSNMLSGGIARRRRVSRITRRIGASVGSAMTYTRLTSARPGV